MLLALLILVCVFVLGYGIACRFFKDELFPASVLFGILIYTWGVFLLSSVLGFSMISISVIAFFSAIAAFFLLKDHFSLKDIPAALFEKDSLAVFLVSLLIAGYVSFISISFSNGFSVATQDFALHLGIINTVANGNFPPHYPNFSEQPLSYYYFTDLFASTLVTGGLNHIFAFQLVLSLLVASFVTAFYSLSRNLLNSRIGALFAILLMFIVSPCTGCQHGGAAWFSPFYPPPIEKIMVSGPKGFPFAPTLLSFPFSQPPMAFGFLFLSIFASYVTGMREKNHLALGAAIGLLPMFNAFFFIALLAIFFVFIIYYRKKGWLSGFVAALAIAAPQFAFLLSDKLQNTLAQSFFRPELFAYSQNLYDLAMFWLLNAGGHMALAILAFFLWEKANRDIELILLGVLALFAFGNFFVIAPYRWDSNKLFLPLLLFVCIYAAFGIEWLRRENIFTKAAFAAIVLLALASSYYQFFIFFNPVFPQAPVHLADGDFTKSCLWIAGNVPSGSVFLADYSLEKSSCIYSLGGRQVFLSVPFWAETHGFDTNFAKSEQQRMLSYDLEAIRRNGITHILADEGLSKQISPALRQHLRLAHSENGVFVYEIVQA